MSSWGSYAASRPRIELPDQRQLLQRHLPGHVPRDQGRRRVLPQDQPPIGGATSRTYDIDRNYNSLQTRRQQRRHPDHGRDGRLAARRLVPRRPRQRRRRPDRRLHPGHDGQGQLHPPAGPALRQARRARHGRGRPTRHRPATRTACLADGLRRHARVTLGRLPRRHGRVLPRRIGQIRSRRGRQLPVEHLVAAHRPDLGHHRRRQDRRSSWPCPSTATSWAPATTPPAPSAPAATPGSGGTTAPTATRWTRSVQFGEMYWDPTGAGGANPYGVYRLFDDAGTYTAEADAALVGGYSSNAHLAGNYSGYDWNNKTGLDYSNITTYFFNNTVKSSTRTREILLTLERELMADFSAQINLTYRKYDNFDSLVDSIIPEDIYGEDYPAVAGLIVDDQSGPWYVEAGTIPDEVEIGDGVFYSTGGAGGRPYYLPSADYPDLPWELLDGQEEQRLQHLYGHRLRPQQAAVEQVVHERLRHPAGPEEPLGRRTSSTP
ncbi:MAG: hypothetical protein MZV49_03030, partial [Rhodopseudomonas palustris]|nr:hypothetical protein [Rhodopseudomonas palustris]